MLRKALQYRSCAPGVLRKRCFNTTDFGVIPWSARSYGNAEKFWSHTMVSEVLRKRGKILDRNCSIAVDHGSKMGCCVDSGYAKCGCVEGGVAGLRKFVWGGIGRYPPGGSRARDAGEKFACPTPARSLKSQVPALHESGKSKLRVLCDEQSARSARNATPCTDETVAHSNTRS